MIPQKSSRLSSPPISSEWMNIVFHVKQQKDISASFCVGCGKGSLRDKNNGQYPVNKKMTLAEVQAIIQKIREINNV